ncbi:DUF4426 domain-containing protein [Luteimonas sp. 50]|uniref:DUF4426 domain-containing protein n=1 Tax=Cognatiluteimonas sedimenti TaxID=2927791 RepID=A0ABT0A4B3_9GAMM|nr:DUF4426 domain-containing protein [Lysobacter sedimenti]MCJ0825804.1 DUF4426 domain-containing protein [Lysobacter sedimenti]
MQKPHLVLALSLSLLGACGQQPSPAAVAPAPAPADSQGEAVVRIGDVTIRASAVQTAALNAGVAARYGIARDPATVLLLVTVRKGGDADAVSLPATVTATATDLRGGRQQLAMHALETGGLVDYVGTVSTTLPETLRFDVAVVPAGAGATRLQLSRDFFPL